MFDGFFPSEVVWQFGVRAVTAGGCRRRTIEKALTAELTAHVLTSLGVAGDLSARGAAGEPLWPAGVCGSISHTMDANGAVAVVCAAAKGRYQSIGLDLQNAIRKPACNLRERIVIGAENPRTDFETLRLFSAKEAVYKAFYPLVKQFFGFSDAELLWDESSQIYRGRLLKQLSPFSAGHEFSLRSMLKDNLILSLLVLS